jgi:hypothetical protein
MHYVTATMLVPFISLSCFCDQKSLFRIESNILSLSDTVTLPFLNTTVASWLSQAVNFVNQMTETAGWICVSGGNNAFKKQMSGWAAL